MCYNKYIKKERGKMKRKYNIVVCPRWDLPIKPLNTEAGIQFCERELQDMYDGEFPLPLLDVDNVISNIRLDILTYLFFIKPEYDSFFQLVKDVANKKQDIEKILQDIFGELCDHAKKRILVIEKEVRGMYKEFKNDDGKTVDEEFGNNVRPALVPVIHKIEESLTNFVQTGYSYQHEYIANKYPEAIRIEEGEDGEQVEVMDLLFFFDPKCLNVDLLERRVESFIEDMQCDARILLIKKNSIFQPSKMKIS